MTSILSFVACSSSMVAKKFTIIYVKRVLFVKKKNPVENVKAELDISKHNMTRRLVVMLSEQYLPKFSCQQTLGL